MGIYVAVKDFKYIADLRTKKIISVKEGEEIEMSNNEYFPDLEDKMLHLNYIAKKGARRKDHKEVDKELVKNETPIK